MWDEHTRTEYTPWVLFVSCNFKGLDMNTCTFSFTKEEGRDGQDGCLMANSFLFHPHFFQAQCTASYPWNVEQWSSVLTPFLAKHQEANSKRLSEKASTHSVPYSQACKPIATMKTFLNCRRNAHVLA